MVLPASRGRTRSVSRRYNVSGSPRKNAGTIVALHYRRMLCTNPMHRWASGTALSPGDMHKSDASAMPPFHTEFGLGLRWQGRPWGLPVCCLLTGNVCAPLSLFQAGSLVSVRGGIGPFKIAHHPPNASPPITIQGLESQSFSVT